MRIVFGVQPRKGTSDIGRPASLTNGRGTTAVQSHIAKTLASADAYAWLDETPDSFDIVADSRQFQTLKCKGQLLRMKHERPGAFIGRVARTAGKKTNRK